MEINPTADSLGAYFVTSPGTLRFMGPITFSATVVMSGNGTIDFNNTGTTLVNGPYNITGTTLVHGGVVNMNTTSLLAGSFEVSSGLLKFSGDRTFDSVTNISGAGTVEFASGIIIINGSYSLNSSTGVTVVSGASVRMANNSTPGLGTQLAISSGELDLVSGHTAGVDTFDLTGGRLTGSDNLNTNFLNWSGGRMAGSGTTIAAETLTMSGSLFLDGTRILSFTNKTNSTPNWIAAGSLSGTGAFLNSGKLIKNDASTTSLSMSSFSHSD